MKRTRVVHVTDESTMIALAKRKNGQTLRALAQELGEPRFSIAMLSNVLCHRPGKVSLATENDLRQRLGLHPIGAVVINRCPSCGGAHVLADCHGAPVAAVVGLAPGETIKRPGKSRTRRTYYRPCLALDPAERIPQLRALLAEAEREEQRWNADVMA